ncbi:hypothetical protein [Streptomyces sp. NPDC001594]|uniref:hypothetical protein n=1 Tax=Streptomyces sp. NPDC001594 TaxID=3364590 RepID=UPI0036D0EFD2
MDDLLRRGKPWTDLFTAWYASRKPPEQDLARWRALVLHHETKSDSTFRITKAQHSLWNGLVKADFFEECSHLRAWLEEERQAAEAALDKELGTASWWGRRDREKQVAERTRTNMTRSLAAAQMDEKNRADGGTDHDLAAGTLVYLNAYMAGYTRKVKPRFMSFYQKLSDAAEGAKGDGIGAALERLGESHMELVAAEAALRRAVLGEVREEVLDAWGAYAHATTKEAAAMVEACAAFLSWAAEDAYKKIHKNFGTVHPELVTAEVVLQGALLVMNLTVQALVVAATGPAAPAFLPVAATTGAVLQAVVRAAIAALNKLVSCLNAKDPETIRRMIVGDFSASKPRRALEKASNTVAWGALLANPGMEAIATTIGGTAGGTVGKAVPFVGQVMFAVDLGFQVEELANPREFVKGDEREREALLEMVNTAFGGTDASAQDPDITILGVFDPVTKSVRVRVNGMEGVITHGRFVPDDVEPAGAEGALKAWARGGGAFVNGVDGFTARDTVMGPVGSFRVEWEGEPVTPENVTAAVTCTGWAANDGGVFQCVANATSHNELGRAEWRIDFDVTPEGRGMFRGEDIRSLVACLADDEEISVHAHQREDIDLLLEWCTPDLLKDLFDTIPWALDVPRQHFGIVNGCLTSHEGAELTDFHWLGLRLPDLYHLKQLLDTHSLPGNIDLELLEVLAADYPLSGWQAPLASYVRAKRDTSLLPDLIDQGCERFLRLVESDADLLPDPVWSPAD